jgi:multiple sugar transport system permease protein/raffinose/stachyose/melibiose transport system permease protein
MTAHLASGTVRGESLKGDSPRMRTGPRHLYRLWFALPAILLVIFFFVTPFVANGFLSFTRWTGFSKVIRFNGLNNFQSLISLGILGHATLVTIIFAVTTMLGQNLAGLALAKALQETNRINSFFRSLFFIPVLISPLAAGYIWAAVLAAHGPLNQAIAVFSPGFAFPWLGNSTSALILVGLIDAWKWSGLVTLVYISGLKSIPRSVMEASVLDGAGAWRRFLGIEMPLLAPAFTFNIVLTLVGSFSALDVIFATTKGGPGDATSVLNVAVFNQYGQGFFGTSSALSFMIAILVIVTAVPLIWYLRSREMHA